MKTHHQLRNCTTIPPAVVGVPAVGVGFFESSSWYYFAAYTALPDGSWRRLYSRGPMWLTGTEAEIEFVDTMEAFWRSTSFMWIWTGTMWRLQRKSG